MNNFGKIKNFIQIASPNKFVWFLQFLMFLLIYLLNIYFAIPSANAITSITIGDFEATAFWLIVACGVVVVQQLLNFFANRLYYAQYSHIWQKIHGAVYKKVSNASNESFLDTSKEKIINTLYNNMDSIGSFPDKIATYFSYFIQAIISIIILLTYNIIIGAAIVLVCVILYFVLNAINKKIGDLTDKHYSCQDKALETFSDSYSNQNLTQDLNLSQTLKSRFTKNLNKSLDYKIKFGNLYSVTANWIPFCYKVIIFALSVYMVYLTKSNIFTLTLYLVLTDYLTKAITQMTNSYSILDHINTVHVACLRVKTILEMKDQDIIEYGNNVEDNITGNVLFTNVSYSSKSAETAGNIEKFNLKIEKNTSTLIYGSHKCGKRAIFYLLNRSIKPSTGTITIDNINIYDFDKETFKHNLATASNKEYFYNDTIMNNMLLSGANKTKIFNTCKNFGLHEKIVQTANSYNTNLHKEPGKLSAFDTYLLGVARAVCTNAEIIVLYEFPSGLTSEQKDRLQKILKDVSQDHTLIIFSYSDWAKEICKNIYKVEKNKILKVRK